MKKMDGKKVNFIIGWVILFAGIIVDQLTKLWATGALIGGKIINIIGLFNLVYVENRGAAWGIFNNHTIILTIASAIMSVVFIVLLILDKGKRGKLFSISMSLITAGAIGNLIDRVFAGFVVDFIEFAFIDFPVFNVADICVTFGAILLLVYIFFYMDKDGKTKVKKNEGEENGEARTDA